MKTWVIDWTKGDVQIPAHLNDVIFFGSQDTGEQFKDKGLVFLGNDDFKYDRWNKSDLCLNQCPKIILSYVAGHKSDLFKTYPNGFLLGPILGRSILVAK